MGNFACVMTQAVLAILVLLIRFYVFIKDLIKSCWLDYLLWGIIRFNNRMR